MTRSLRSGLFLAAATRLAKKEFTVASVGIHDTSP